MADIKTLKAEWDLRAVLAAHGVTLRRQGRGWVGRCPFHQDRGRPNFTVDPTGQRWRCWVCGIGGDVVDFVAQWEGCSIGEAARRLQASRSALAHPAARPHPARDPVTPALAPMERRHAVYTALLARCPLSPEHRDALQRRGLSPEAIQSAGYGTLPDAAARASVVQALLDAGCDLTGVPGCGRLGPDGPWRLWGPPGLLIPVRDAHGRIQGVQVRTAAAGPRRYRWLSTPATDRLVGGASSGAPIHVAGRAALGGNTVWITEGPLKADVAAHFLRQPVLGLPGVSLWRGVPEAVADWVMGQAVLAFDQDPDPETQARVAAHARALAAALRAQWWAVFVAAWPPAYKGVDDALAAGARVTVRPFPDA